MKVIFLDIDGILNRRGCDVFIDGFYFVMDGKIELLKQLVDRTGARIVLSSTWRQGWFDIDFGNVSTRDAAHFIALRDKLLKFGIEIMSRTPIRTFDDRGQEIDMWLKSWKGESIESFVILDDMNGRYLRPHSNRLVRTSFEKGLLQKHVELAVKLLEKPLKGTEF